MNDFIEKMYAKSIGNEQLSLIDNEYTYGHPIALNNAAEFYSAMKPDADPAVTFCADGSVDFYWKTEQYSILMNFSSDGLFDLVVHKRKENSVDKIDCLHNKNMADYDSDAIIKALNEIIQYDCFSYQYRENYRNAIQPICQTCGNVKTCC